MRMYLAVGIGVVVALLQSGAASQSTPSQHPGVRFLSGGRSDTTVINVGPRVNAGIGRLVEELSIGRLDGDSNYVFGNVAGVAVDDSGTIYVADQANAQIRVYDRNGRHKLSFGRRGQGPGEFDARAAVGHLDGPAGIALTPRGIITSSARGRGVHLYSRTGAVLQDISGRDFYNVVLWYDAPLIPLDRSGQTLVFVELRWPTLQTAGGRRIEFTGYLRLQRDGTVRDTLIIPVQKDDPPIAYAGQLPRPSRKVQIPFTPTFTWGISPLGYFVTGMARDYSGRYAIDLRIPPTTSGRGAAVAQTTRKWQEGDPVVSLRVPYTPVRVEAREAADWVAYHQASFRQTRAHANWTWNTQRPPANKPPYRQFWVDEEERIWVTLHGPAAYNRSGETIREQWAEQTMFDIVAATGRYVGRVAYSGNINPQVARGDRMWAIVRGEFGTLEVKRYRIVW